MLKYFTTILLVIFVIGLVSITTKKTTPNDEECIFLVYRAPYEGVNSKRVVKLKAISILEWFQNGWDAINNMNPTDWIKSECDGDIHDLSLFFNKMKQENLPKPNDWNQLADYLHQYLPLEHKERIAQDEHSLRFMSDDDEVSIAVYFFDTYMVEKYPNKTSYLLYDRFELPVKSKEVNSFTHNEKSRELFPKATGVGKTYFCFLTFYDSDTFGHTVHELNGARFSDLVRYLRSIQPEKISVSSTQYYSPWPRELILLRSFIDEDDTTIENALRECNNYPIFQIDAFNLGLGSIETAQNEFETAKKSVISTANPDMSHIKYGETFAQLAMHCSKNFGYQQWYIFDDLWAMDNADLANSLIRYTSNWWDPFE